MTEKVRLFTRQGWILLGLCALILESASKPTIDLTMFFFIFILEFEWPHASISLVLSIFSVSTSLSGILMGALSDRFSLRRILTAGALIAASGFALSSLTQSRWHLYLFYGVVAGAGIGAFHVPVFAFIQRSFSRRRGLATAFVGQVKGILLVDLWLPFVLADTGWRAGFIIHGGVILALTLPLAYLFQRTLIAKSEESRASASAPLKRGADNPARPFDDGKWRWLYAILAISIGIAYCISALKAHWNSIGIDLGFKPETTMLALRFTPYLASSVGCIGCGLLSDRFGAKWPLFASVALVTTSVPLHLGPGAPAVYFLFLMLYGLGAGGLFTAYPVLLRDLFGPKHIGLHLGIILFGSYIGGGVSAIATGHLHDATGSYTLPLLLSFAIGIISLLLAWLIPDRRTPASAPESAVLP